MQLASESYDAVIVGGGPAGSSAAIHLAISGARVLLAEQKRFPRAKLCGEFISPECIDHFTRLGVSDDMMAAPQGVSLTETVFYARNGRSVTVPSTWFGGGNVSALGMSRAEMDARLLARARQVGVEVCEDSHATNLMLDGVRVCGVELNIGNDRKHNVRGLVTLDATGRSRHLARRVEKRSRRSSFKNHRQARLVAFKTHLTGARGNAEHCEIYSYPGGYGGLNSIENGLSNLCFIASARDARAFGGDAQKLMREVVGCNKRAYWTLADARNVSPWMAVALDGFGRRSLVPANGLITIGDAASFIDPFTGSGMLMALESGELAAASVMRNLPGLRQSDSFHQLADDYRAGYEKRFASRLRVSAGLRSAAFVPYLAEGMILMVGASDRIRRRLARATRTSPDNALILPR